MIQKKFEIMSTYAEVEKINSVLKVFYQKNKFNVDDIIELEIILVEALNNIVKHAYKEKSSMKIIIEMKVENGVWEIRLVDFGISRENKKIKPLNFEPKNIDSLPESGMGLFLINKLTDFNKYLKHTDRNEFILQKKLRNETTL